MCQIRLRESLTTESNFPSQLHAGPLRSMLTSPILGEDYSFFPTDEVPFHFEFEDARLTTALRQTLGNIDPAPHVMVHSRYRPEQRGIWEYKQQKERELRAAGGLLAAYGSSDDGISSGETDLD
jgi:hypothetical protein